MKFKDANVTPAEPKSTENKKPRIKLNRYQIISIVCASILVALSLGVGIYFIVKNKQNERKPREPLAVVLTMDNYNLITDGMSYSEVFDILGSGKQTPSPATGEISYTWADNNGRYIVITFEAEENAQGQLVPTIVKDKGQLGLEE